MSSLFKKFKPHKKTRIYCFYCLLFIFLLKILIYTVSLHMYFCDRLHSPKMHNLYTCSVTVFVFTWSMHIETPACFSILYAILGLCSWIICKQDSKWNWYGQPAVKMCIWDFIRNLSTVDSWILAITFMEFKKHWVFIWISHDWKTEQKLIRSQKHWLYFNSIVFYFSFCVQLWWLRRNYCACELVYFDNSLYKILEKWDFFILWNSQCFKLKKLVCIVYYRA